MGVATGCADCWRAGAWAVSTCTHSRSNNPRLNPPDRDPTCVKCGRPFTPPLPPGRERDKALEEHLTNMAGEAVGLLEAAASISNFADHRALPGPVLTEGRDFDMEVLEELADARNYLVWSLQGVYEAAKDGDSDASAAYGRRMRCLGAVVEAYNDLLYRGP